VQDFEFKSQSRRCYSFPTKNCQGLPRNGPDPTPSSLSLVLPKPNSEWACIPGNYSIRSGRASHIMIYVLMSQVARPQIDRSEQTEQHGLISGLGKN